MDKNVIEAELLRGTSEVIPAQDFSDVLKVKEVKGQGRV